MSINALRNLGDDQIKMALQKAEQGDTSSIEAAGFFSAAPFLYELKNRERNRLADQARRIQQEPSTLTDEALASVSGVGALSIPGMMEEQNYAHGGIVAFAKGEGGEELTFEQFRNRTEKAESGGDPNAIGPMTRYGTAKGKMQVLDMTNRDPGFGVTPARNDSLEERARVGNDYLEAMVKRYNYYPYASLAYNWGPGNVDKWLKRGANPSEIPAESRAYVAKTSGVDLGKMGSGTTIPRSVPQKTEQPGIDYASRLKKAGEDYEANKKANEEFYSKEMEGIKAPEKIDQEGIRAAYMDRFKKFSDPMFQELRGLLEQQKPDSEAARRTNFNNALMTAGLAMMGTPGGLGRAISSGGLRGLAQYAEGEEGIQKQNRDFLNATIKSKQYEFGLAKEAVESAEDAVKNAVREYGIDSRVAQKAMADLRQAKFNANKLAYQERALVERGIIQERVEDARNQRAAAALASREGIAAGRQGAREGQEAGKEARRDETALQRAYEAALKDDDGYRKYRAERIKSGYKDQIKSKEEWAREVAPSRIYKNQPSTQEQAPAAVSGGNKTLKLFE
jgi:hypothetical protein